jgi:small redox-active disulfide protein 2
MHIKILGSGCANCHTLERLAREAVTELGLTAEITAVTDYPTIVGYGVMATPALVVDEQVVMSGRVPSKAQVSELLTTAASGS